MALEFDEIPKTPKYIENHVIQYAKYMKKAKEHQAKLNDWLENYGVYVGGENEWVLDQIIDSIEYGHGGAEDVLATIQQLLIELK